MENNNLNYSSFITGEIDAYIKLPAYNMSSGRNVNGKWIPEEDTEGGPKLKYFKLSDVIRLQKENLDIYHKDYTFLEPISEYCILITADKAYYVKGNYEELNEQLKNAFKCFYDDEKRFEKKFEEFEKAFKNGN